MFVWVVLPLTRSNPFDPNETQQGPLKYDIATRQLMGEGRGTRWNRGTGKLSWNSDYGMQRKMLSWFFVETLTCWIWNCWSGFSVKNYANQQGSPPLALDITRCASFAVRAVAHCSIRSWPSIQHCGQALEKPWTTMSGWPAARPSESCKSFFFVFPSVFRCSTIRHEITGLFCWERCEGRYGFDVPFSTSPGDFFGVDSGEHCGALWGILVDSFVNFVLWTVRMQPVEAPATS